MVWTLITGGAKGLGREITTSLAKEGHNVLVHFRKSQGEAEIVAAECKKFGVFSDTVQADFSTPDGVQGLLDHIQQKGWNVKFLINNVGNFYQATPTETLPDVWYELFQTNLHAPFFLMRGLLPAISANLGAIVNIGSVGCNDMRAEARFTAYSLTKRSLLFLTKSFAKEVAESGVRVNMVSPGELDNSVTLQDTEGKLPMARAGTLKEVAGVAAFLLRPENAYITGQNIEVAGGFAL